MAQDINVNIVEQKIQVDIQGAIVYTQGGDHDENLQLVNLESTDLLSGELVFGNSGSTGCQRASASQSPAIGFNMSDTTPGSIASIITATGGLLTLNSWVGVTGTSTLTPNQVYFLSLVEGKLVTTPDMSTALFVQPIGIAINSTTMKYQIEEPIWL